MPSKDPSHFKKGQAEVVLPNEKKYNERYDIKQISLT